jgi:SAM-dependent methyltransferase
MSASAPYRISNATSAASGALAQPQTALPCWCGAGEWKLCFRTSRSGLLRCSACGSFQTDPPPLHSEEESADFYTDYYLDKEVPGDVVRPQTARNAWFWKVAEHVPQLMETRTGAVDIGSGDGHFCAELRAAGWPNVSGIEISGTRVARARRLYPEIPFFACPLGGTGIAAASLDLIVMDSVIEHLPRPAQMVNDLRDFLAPGGALVILTPNMECGHFRFLGSRWTGMLAPHAHIFLFTGSGLAQMLTSSGLAVQAIGSLHMPAYRPGEYARRLISGDLKGTLWRAHQEIGGLYGRVIGAGPMLYAVATRPR